MGCWSIGWILDEANHHSAGMLPTRLGLVRSVWAGSEAESCTARVKWACSSGVSEAHMLSTEALSTNVQHSMPRATRPSQTHQGHGQYLPATAPGYLCLIIALCSVADTNGLT
jgi:hypothetical protein